MEAFYQKAKALLTPIIREDMGITNTHRAFLGLERDEDGECLDFQALALADYLPGGYAPGNTNDEWPDPEGWDYLGAGAFSICLKVPGLPARTVLKISFVALDVGPAYWAYCKENEGAEYIPKVYASGRDRENGWRWCVMEECEELDSCETIDLRADFQYVAPEIYEWASAQGCIDLHGGNVMASVEDGRWLITDPVSMTPSDRHRVWGA